MAFKFPKIKKLPRLVGCHLRDNKYAQYQSAFYLFFCLKLRWNSPNVKLRTLNCWTDIETFDYKQLRRTQHVPGDNTLVRPLWRVIWWRLPKFLVFILQIYLHWWKITHRRLFICTVFNRKIYWRQFNDHSKFQYISMIGFY